jgi:hypothetical protein
MLIMNNKNLISVNSFFTLLLAMVISCGFFTACTKKDLPPDTPPPFVPKPINQPGKYFIMSVFGSDKNLGLLINDPIIKMQYAAFGKKKNNGELDTLLFIVETDMETGGWLAHELNEDYTPSSTSTSTGHTIEYENFDESTKTGSITIKETATGRVIHRTGKVPINDGVWNNLDRMKEINKKRGNFPPGWQGELVYVASAGFGCIMGIAGLSTGNPIALGWGIYNTYQNCKSFAEAANNIFNGQPAFGCISTADNANALSGFAETISQGGSTGSLATGLIPAVMNYVAQDAVAGQCESQQPPEDPLAAGGGWGDPHIFTADGRMFDFHGYGEFIAAKSLTDNFEVQVRQLNTYFVKAQATVNTAIAVQTGEDVVCITAGPQKLYINKVQRDFNFTTLVLRDGALIKKVQEKNFPVLIIKHKNGDEIKVRLDPNYTSGFFDYTVRLIKNRAGKVKGLLGNCDGEKENDIQLSNGQTIDYVFEQMYPAYADSWRITQASSLFYYDAGKNTDSYTKKDFPSSPAEITPEKLAWAEEICKNAGVTEQPALCNCAFDVAATDDPAMAGSALWGMQTWSSSNQPFDIEHIAMQGEAALIDGRIRLTTAKVFTSGQAFHTQSMTGNFETEFSFRIPYSGNGGADGLALLIAKDIPTLTMNVYPGSAGKLGYNGVPSSLAVEFDTWTDAGENSNHVAIHTKGTEPNSTHYTAAVATNQNIPELQGGAIHKAKIRYADHKISVWVDGVLALEYAVDIFVKLGLTDKFYVGITASTSGSFQEHSLVEWKVKGL